VISRGIEASSALHILNNFTGIFMAGLGFGSITAEQTVFDSVFVLVWFCSGLETAVFPVYPLCRQKTSLV